MAEMIIPGTYVTVRAEGLVSAGRIATGIVGVVGTASAGPLNEPVTLADPAAAREIFGPYDEPTPDGSPPKLTLARSLEYLYANGATSLIAVRVAGKGVATATYVLKDANDKTLATLSALTPGTWGNSISISIGRTESPGRIVGERDTNLSKLPYPGIKPSPENRIQVIRGKTREVQTFSLRYVAPTAQTYSKSADGSYAVPKEFLETKEKNRAIRVMDSKGSALRTYGHKDIAIGEEGEPEKGKIRINPTTRTIAFAPGEAPAEDKRVEVTSEQKGVEPRRGEVVVTLEDGTLDFVKEEMPSTKDGDQLIVDTLIEPQNCVEITLSRGAVKESYIVPNAGALPDLLSASRLARVESVEAEGLPATQATSYFGSGNDGVEEDEEGADDVYRAGLDVLSSQTVNIVLLAGQDSGTMGSVLVGHLKATEQIDRERMGVIGASGKTVSEYLGHTLAEDRVVLVAPGIRLPNGSLLPTAYTAAAVAGLMASLPVQASLTNKVLNVPGLQPEPNRGDQEKLIGKNVLAVARKEGFRVVKGVTTQGEGQPFSSIPIRRIVDYAKYGVRSAANPYIGKLNNSRVRSALKSALDAFLTRMVEDEALTGYELEVTATRAQEVAGEVSVNMTLQPTFSIDYIRVTMTLK